MNNIAQINRTCADATEKLLEASVIIPALEKTIEHLQQTTFGLRMALETCHGMFVDMRTYLPATVHPQIDRLTARLESLLEACQ